METRRWFGRLTVLSVTAFLTLTTLGAGDPKTLDEEMRAYKQTAASGAVSRLIERLTKGQTQLAYEEPHGYLKSVLRELGIPVSSQILVASKTSANRPLISPKNPRALYFNAEASIAYVPSSEVLEFAANDPKLGVVFYTLEQKPVPQPIPTRDDRCLECHISSKTLDVAGLLVRSFLTEDSGRVDMLSGIMVNHRTPLLNRWGGYYVTGTHGNMWHSGNIFGDTDLARHARDPAFNGNITDLRPFLEVKKYPEPGSDIVALLVLDHQVHMQNLLIRLRRDATRALKEDGSLEKAFPAFESALNYMLFREEAPLTAQVQGASQFAVWFERQGPKDKEGHSLTQFDLKTRLFRYPCSYMVYSNHFDELPTRVRRHFYRRLWEVLTGQDASPTYQTLHREDRENIRKILLQTKSNLPRYWGL